MTLEVHDVGELAELVGRELEPSDWVEVTQDQVDRFADVVNDRHWAHNEPEVAAAGPFGGIRLTGALTTEIDGADRPACVAQGVWRHYAVGAPG